MEGGFSVGWVGEQWQECLELEERARPAVGEDERDGVVAWGRSMDEVEVEAVDVVRWWSRALSRRSVARQS